MTKLVGAGSYRDWEIEELRRDREFASEYLKAALESLHNPDERAGALLCLRSLAEAYGGLGAIAAKAGLSREALYRSHSPTGNPTLKTLIAVLSAMNLQLSIAEKKPARAAKKKARNPRAA